LRRPLFVPISWPREADELLGTMSDRELARHLNLDPHTVAARRRVLNIPPWRQSKSRHMRRCVVCGRTFEVVGGRLSQMRKTCPPKHRFTRAGRLSDCQRQLISRTLMITGNQPTSARGLVKRIVGRGAVDLLGD
jgi:hypothetical protein